MLWGVITGQAESRGAALRYQDRYERTLSQFEYRAALADAESTIDKSIDQAIDEVIDGYTEITEEAPTPIAEEAPTRRALDTDLERLIAALDPDAPRVSYAEIKSRSKLLEEFAEFSYGLRTLHLHYLFDTTARRTRLTGRRYLTA